MKWFILLAILMGCTTQPGSSTTSECGPVPRAPGMSVYYPNKDTAIMPAVDMQADLAWRDEMLTWANCAQGL